MYYCIKETTLFENRNYCVLISCIIDLLEAEIFRKKFLCVTYLWPQKKKVEEK